MSGTVFETIAKSKEENTDQKAIDFMNDGIDFKTDDSYIDRSHRVGLYDKTKKKAKPIAVKFDMYKISYYVNNTN